MAEIKPQAYGNFENDHANLLDRLGAFLPKIKAANLELSDDKELKRRKIDDSLQEQDEDTNDDEAGEQQEGERKGPTVQLEIALGDLEKNKEVFDLLLPSNDKAEVVKENDDDRPRKAAENVVSNLLQNDKTEKKQQSKILIQEIS
mmetsp:Transcript_36926/g.42118  ORF Transcript_36926/g.42118 Transcript_36926/m.42118 type:complete len:146 (-) Transcript_36926:147-584(-)